MPLIHRAVMLALAGICLVAPGNAARAVEPDVEGLVSLLKLSGRCLRVQLAREELGRGCTGELAIAVYADSRVGFHFMLGNGHILTVSGLHGETSSAVTIDRVVLNAGLETTRPNVFVALGTCSYGNPYDGRMTVRCSGTFGKRTDFAVAFETDGTPPSE